MLILKLTVAAMFVAVLFVLSKVVYHAVRKELASHEKWARRGFRLTLIAVLMTEITVQVNGGVTNWGFLYFHLCFALPFLVLYGAIVYRFSGFRNPGLHKVLGYVCYLLYLGTFITGMMLLRSI